MTLYIRTESVKVKGTLGHGSGTNKDVNWPYPGGPHRHTRVWRGSQLIQEETSPRLWRLRTVIPARYLGNSDPVILRHSKHHHPGLRMRSGL